MEATISVSFDRRQGNFGYCASVIDSKGEEQYVYSRIGTDPGEAAAKALMLRARFGGRIVACKKVMDIVA